MRLALHHPAPPLDRWVEMLWIYEGDGSVAPGTCWRERVMPTGTMQLIIDLSAGGPCISTATGMAIVGAQTRSQVVRFEARMVLAAVHFHPGGAAPFFGLPMGELGDAEVPLELLWGRFSEQMRAQLHDAHGDAARFALLERALHERLLAQARRVRHGEPGLHPAVRMALHRWGAPGLERPMNGWDVLMLPTVSDLVGQSGLSARRFTEIFTAQVGQPPKRYSRLRRFQAALGRLHAGPDFDGAELALACGYHDQAHFNHDFRAFAGATPTQYRAQRTEHANHMLVDDGGGPRAA